MSKQTKFAKTDANKVTRFTSTHVSVEVQSGPSKGKAYMILALRQAQGTTVTGSCTCSWGLRNGTTCSHIRDAIAFVAAEQAAKVAPVIEAKKSWLEEEMEDGLLVFSSQCS